MKKLIFFLVLLVAGLGLGGGAAFGVAHLLGPVPATEKAAPHTEAVDTEFIPAGTILAPIVAEDGNLSGYANFEVQLEVPKDKAGDIAARLPLLLHAINLRAFRTPMAAGPQHLLPDLRIFAKMVEEAAQESLGKGAILRAVVTSARPV